MLAEEARAARVSGRARSGGSRHDEARSRSRGYNREMKAHLPSRQRLLLGLCLYHRSSWSNQAPSGSLRNPNKRGACVRRAPPLGCRSTPPTQLRAAESHPGAPEPDPLPQGTDRRAPREANRLHKILEDTAIKPDGVTTDIPRASGRPMLDGLVAGTTDPD